MNLGAAVADMVRGLNPQQRAAVVHRGGPLLVLAGAGSGKTRVITVRMAHLVAEGLAPENILALTFTNKAAGEMAERVAGLVGHEAARAMTVGTFHSLGLRMVEEDARRLGFSRQFTLLDAADQASAVRHCLRSLRIDPKRHDPAVFLTAISNARNAGQTPDDVAAQPGRRITAQVYAAYLAWLEAYQAIDFDDLILRPVQLLREHADLRAKWRARFRTVLVDEYQDTNGMQFELMRLLVEEHRSLCVVGDDDQAIYGWRGAQVSNILDFDQHFPDATMVALTQNYRSSGHILEAANAVIRRNDARKVKSLWTDVGLGERVQVVACKDAQAEAAWVAGEISRRASVEGRPFRDFGVLFRTGKQSDLVQDALRMAGVPFAVVGAFDFYERKEVKDMLSYLKLVTNPRDQSALMRVINFPQRGIGPKTLETLHAFAKANNVSPLAAMQLADEMEGLTQRQVEAMLDFHDVITEAGRRYAEAPDLAGLVAWICERTGAREAWIRDPTEGPGGHARWRNIEALMRSMRSFQQRRPKTELRDYLRLIALDKHQDQEEGAADAVTLMTLHASKGLEWPVCFVIGCQDGVVPHQRVLEESGGDVSEERRLFYVGITRARRHCYLSYGKTRRKFQGSEPARPSRFLADIPATHREDKDLSRGQGEVEREEARRRFAELKARLGG